MNLLPNPVITPVLFCQKNSVYSKLGCDVYDIDRDAFSYNLNLPIIAHPPCRLWSRMRGLSTAPACERLTGVFSVKLVQMYGGIVEQPYPSKLWEYMNLPYGSNIDQYGGFTLKLSQRWFGHVAEKPTLIYIVGINPGSIPAYPVTFDLPTHSLGSGNSGLKQASKKLRSYTPIEFAKWLIAIHCLILASHTSHNSNSASVCQ